MMKMTYRLNDDIIYRGIIVNDAGNNILNQFMGESLKSKAEIKNVMYNPPATIMWFTDGDKVVSKCDKADSFSKEAGLMTCLLKKYLGKKKFYKIMDKYVYDKEND